MIRQDINISGFKYICDMFDAESDYYPIVYNQYVILRNVNFINNVAEDTDIYFIEKSIYNEIYNNNFDSNIKTTDKVVFPCHNTNFGSFSTSYIDFTNADNKNFLKLDKDGGSVFTIYGYAAGSYTSKELENKNTEERGHFTENVNLLCDRIRIYHPHNKPDLDFIIYLDNMINGIHFHYFCNYNKNCSLKSDTEICIGNNRYSEYFELYIPNINDIFKEHPIEYNENGTIKRDDNKYINDYYNSILYINTSEDRYNINNVSNGWISFNKDTIINRLFDDAEHISMLPLYMMVNPFITQNIDGIDEKIYFKMPQHDCNNYNSLPINITLYPYEESSINNILLMNSNYVSNSDTYVKNYNFNMVSKIGFAHNQLCLINKFIYNEMDSINVQEAYAKYNNLTLIKNEETGLYECVEYNNWKSLNPDDRYTEHEQESEINCCGYQFEIASDYKFENIIMSDYKEMKFIDNFDFTLVDAFNNWYNIPNILICRVKFIDKYIGITLNTGFIILNKEWIKYSILKTSSTRLYSDFTAINKVNQLNNMSWNTINTQDGNVTFNFIDKINCVVAEKDNTNININNLNNTKIVYKPIFYRVQDLQTISIKTGLQQKIGINLAQYMTKVSIFKLNINNMQLIEYGRNDIYVIFDINASMLSTKSGTYDITNENDEYISSGNWILN